LAAGAFFPKRFFRVLPMLAACGAAAVGAVAVDAGADGAGADGAGAGAGVWTAGEAPGIGSKFMTFCFGF
jgi:hypothetical protein